MAAVVAVVAVVAVAARRVLTARRLLAGVLVCLLLATFLPRAPSSSLSPPPAPLAKLLRLLPLLPLALFPSRSRLLGEHRASIAAGSESFWERPGLATLHPNRALVISSFLKLRGCCLARSHGAAGASLLESA